MVATIMQHGALDACLAAASPHLVVGLLQHCRRALNRPTHAVGAAALAERVLCTCPSALVVDDGAAAAAVERLRGAVGEEVRTLEKLLAVGGQVEGLLLSS